MSVTITKTFWNPVTLAFDTISKIVFTSPNIDSPAAAGTRSYILPGADYIGTWQESVAQMYRVRWNQDPPNKQETYFNKLVMNQETPFNFNTDTSVSIKTSFPTTFSGGQIVNHSRSEYAVVSSYSSTGVTAEGGTNLGSDPFSGAPLNGSMCSDGVYIYRLQNDSRNIYRYSILNNFWEFFIEGPDTFTNYSSCTVVNNFLYCVRGSGNTFWKLDLVNLNWYSIGVTPVLIDSYTDIASFNGTTILFLKTLGTGDKNIYEYTISTDDWAPFFDLTEGNTSNNIWYGPSLFYNSGKYYTFGWECYNASVANLYYYEIDIGALNIDTGRLWYSTTVTGSTSIISAACYGSQTTSGTEAYILAHCFGETDKTANKYLNTFRFAVVSSGIVCDDISGQFDKDCSDCWEGNSGGLDDYNYTAKKLTFTEEVIPQENPASLTSASGIFYFFDKEGIADDGFLYSYKLVPSGTLTGTCDEKSSYLEGEGTFSETWSNLCFSDSKLYVNEGSYTNSFWACDSLTGIWDNFEGPFNYSPTDADRKFTFGEYSIICSDSTDLYVLKGSNYKSFYKYSVVSGTWSVLQDTPAIVSEYGSMAYVSSTNSIFVSQGKLSLSFWEYKIDTNTWVVRQGAPGSFQDKGCLIYPRWGGNYIYALKGEDYSAFWRYSISANTWSVMRSLITYNNLALGMLSKGSDSIYVLNNTYLYKYVIGTDIWSKVDGELSYNDVDKKLAIDNSGDFIFVFGKYGMRKYEFTDIGISNPYPNTYNINFSSVVGTSIIDVTDYFSSWQSGLANSSVWANSKNSIVFTISNGECYDVRLTAWDDVTHSTTLNRILDEEHYKVTAAAFRAEGGTKQEPTCGSNITDCLVYPVVVEQILKGNEAGKYYGDFDLIHIANGGVSGTAHGEYLIFSPRLDDMNESFTSGNYDFVTTLHYQYT